MKSYALVDFDFWKFFFKQIINLSVYHFEDSKMPLKGGLHFWCFVGSSFWDVKFFSQAVHKGLLCCIVVAVGNINICLYTLLLILGSV